MKILGTGLSGLVGSRIVDLLTPQWQFTNLSKETGVDITDKAEVHRYFAKSDAPWVFHLAAYTDVDRAEEDRKLGEQSIAWKTNVTATETIVAECNKTGKHLLYMSTDYVFDGTKDFYTEEDEPSPVGWYARTKFEGEMRAHGMRSNSLILRIANPYRASPVGKKDFVHKIIDRLSAGQIVSAPADQLLSVTYIDDIARLLPSLVGRGASGTYHLVGDTALSPYTAALKIAGIFGYNESLVRKTTFAEFFAGRAPRPFHAVLKNDKIKALGITVLSFEEGLQRIKALEQNAGSS